MAARVHPWLGEKLVALPAGAVAVVTGATGGLGKETAKWLALRGADVVLAVRSREKAAAAVADLRAATAAAEAEAEAEAAEAAEDSGSGEKAAKPGAFHTADLDLASLESVRACGADLARRFPRIDVLVLNAGVMAPPAGSRTADGHELQFGANHLGHALLTSLLLPSLRAAPRGVVSVCSSEAQGYAKTIDFDDLDKSESALIQWTNYAQSKLANALFLTSLVKKLPELAPNVRATGSHPGWTATDLQRHSLMARLGNTIFAMGIEQGTSPQLMSVWAGLQPKSGDAADAAKRVWSDADYYGPKGTFGVRFSGVPSPTKLSNPIAYDDELAERLWDYTNRKTGAVWDASSDGASAGAAAAGSKEEE